MRRGHQKIPFKKRLSSNKSLKKEVISEAKISYRYRIVTREKNPNIIWISYWEILKCRYIETFQNIEEYIVPNLQYRVSLILKKCNFFAENSLRKKVISEAKISYRYCIVSRKKAKYRINIVSSRKKACRSSLLRTHPRYQQKFC